MADRIHGRLHTEQMGIDGAPLMVFVPPNPMDSACWLYQLAHLSTWYRCVAIDLPGYGRSPTAAHDVRMADIAEACWEAVDAVGEAPAVLVGCSVGQTLVQYMYHLRPDGVVAIVLSGASYAESKEFLQYRIDGYEEHGLDYRYQYTLEDFSASFRETSLARGFAELFCARDQFADLASILSMFRALKEPDPDWLSSELHVPTAIIEGSEDNAYQRVNALLDRLPDGELFVMEGAGHACHLERPWEFDQHLLEFLERRGLSIAASRRPKGS